mmetsp:Transcript_4583/g.6608  ORF Transcript_4583/g.6608 Transcript_4583/m.6608 type:complete len:344 (-) Transcript_4583:362-1393(-)|eukprot:CAMPEP_0194223656 /NCGR_PEP_ID=MMETSP0156-20130528/35658_1 /TAXON_ID=33649 /ORGANISM="Thalassionema nitzschioides, Strain L26-B" /LENGTH=343 /DNA_ID=CAMNT_0038954883 /DNA_START=147 /DNA_END=1178 /DNA_ORIENTATION=+
MFSVMSSVSPTKLSPSADCVAPSLWDQLAQKMNPSTCLQGSLELLEEESLESAMESILPDLSSSAIRKQKKAIQRLYDLTNQKNRHKRVDLVQKFRIHSTCLLKLIKAPEHARMGCLILNNLSIPHENKSILLQSNLLLKELYTILEELKPETYLACLILRNLSCEQQHHDRLINFSIGKTLLPLLENMFLTFGPLVMHQDEEKTLSRSSLRSSFLTRSSSSEINVASKRMKSAEFQALTYSAQLLEQLTQTHAGLVAKHVRLIECLLELIQHLVATTKLHDWTQGSLGDACLVTILQLAQDRRGCRVLREDLYAPMYLMGLVGKGGIHDTRASWVQCYLEGL